jgi:hypothetical protein
MQRLRPLSESECYVRCYGERNESVTLIEVRPHPLSSCEPGSSPVLETPVWECGSEPISTGWRLLAVAQPE